MADDKDGKTPPVTPDPNAPPAKKGDDGKGEQEHMIPKSRFDELNAELKTASEKLAKIESDTKTAETERLKQQGEFQKLAEAEKARADKLDAELKAEKVIADRYRAAISVKKESAKKALGDAWLPTFDGIAALEELDSLVEKFAGKKVPVQGAPPAKPELKDVRHLPVKEFSDMVERAKRGEFQ